MTGYGLAYVALSSADPEGLAAVLGDDLGMASRRIDDPGGSVRLFTAGRSGIAVFGNDHPQLDRPGVNGLDHIALVADDPAGAAEGHGLALVDEPALAALDGGPQARLRSEETRGVHLRFINELDMMPMIGDLVERIDHLGVASAGVDGDEALFCANLGCPVESRQTDVEVRTVVESFTSDKYGVIYHNRPPETRGGLRILFATLGDTDLEFLQEMDPDHGREVMAGRPGTTKQDQGAIGRFVAKRGPGLHHVALKTPDIDRTLARLADRGRRMIDPVGRPGSRRARIGFVHPAALGGVLLHFVERQAF